MARAVGLDIGTRTLKVVEMTGSAKSFKVQRVVLREIPSSPPPSDARAAVPIDEDAPPWSRDAAVVEILREVFTSLKLPTEDVCATFDAGATSSREITVPFTEIEQIRKVIRFQAEEHLHSTSIDDVVVNWIKTGDARDGSRITIFASPKAKLAEQLGMLRRAGIEPASVDLDSTALFTALDALGTWEESPNAIALDIGARSTTLMLVANGRPRMVRSFLVGVSTLGAGRGAERPAASPDDLFVTADAAQDGSAPTGELISEKGAEFVRKLHRESILSLGSVSTETPPTRLLLTGGGALAPGVAEALGERFGLPTETIDFCVRTGCKDAGPDPEFAGASIGPAIGCALRMLGSNPLGIELLREDFAPKNRFDVIRTTLATTVTLLFLVVGIYTYGLREQLRAEKAEYNRRAAPVDNMMFQVEKAYLNGRKAIEKGQAEEQARLLIQRGLPRDSSRIAAIRGRMIRYYRELTTDLNIRSDIPELPSAVKCQYEIYNALSQKPREQLGTYFQIDGMTITERRAQFSVIVDTPGVLDDVFNLLRSSKYFEERAKDARNIVKRGAQQRLPNGRVKQDFTLEFEED